MEKSLKQLNTPWLVAVVVTNIAIFLIVREFGFDMTGFKDFFSKTEKIFPLAFVIAAVSVLNAQIGHDNKARLVFWKFKYPLAGCRAFSDYMMIDGRIDQAVLENYISPLPSDPTEQNQLWYKWYREVDTEIAVKQAHKDYLFTRDYTAIAFLLIGGLGGLSLFQMESFYTWAGYMLFLVVQYLLVRNAAKNVGIRFVCNVLAIKSGPNKKEEKQ